jgi:hypothetical protein
MQICRVCGQPIHPCYLPGTLCEDDWAEMCQKLHLPGCQSYVTRAAIEIERENDDDDDNDAERKDQRTPSPSGCRATARAGSRGARHGERALGVALGE